MDIRTCKKTKFSVPFQIQTDELCNSNRLYLANTQAQVGVAGPTDLYLYNTSKCPKFPRWGKTQFTAENAEHAERIIGYSRCRAFDQLAAIGHANGVITPDPGSKSGAGFDPGSSPAFRGIDS